MREVLIATLGTESQVVTLSLLELARLDFNITDVVVIHTNSSNPKIIKALTRLDDAFAIDERLSSYHYQRECLQGKQGPIPDITTQAEAEVTFNTLYRIVRRYKLTNFRIHLNVAGGRKPISIYGMVTAQLLFDEQDCLWHLVSNEALVTSRRLFPQAGDEYSLVPIPVIRGSDRSPVETGLIQAPTPLEALQEQVQLQKDTRYHFFLKSELTRAEQEIVRLMAQGFNNQEIAQQRGVKKNTVEKQINRIYQKWISYWGLDETTQPRRQIVAQLSAYFERKEF